MTPNLLYLRFTSFFFIYYVVGKTSLITRFMYDTFDNTYQVYGSFFYLTFENEILL
jgi:hypothetical protein